ncbi:MAG TPA: hypothetical protein VHJ78_09285 [Actinomycetota bacterium]|nr:hypothetical protein [Actinomycetota bacterium]
MVVGAIWMVQGLGLLETGSFMDRQPVWVLAGAVMLAGGTVATVIQRRRSRPDDGDQPGS